MMTAPLSSLSSGDHIRDDYTTYEVRGIVRDANDGRRIAVSVEEVGGGQTRVLDQTDLQNYEYVDD